MDTTAPSPRPAPRTARLAAALLALSALAACGDDLTAPAPIAPEAAPAVLAEAPFSASSVTGDEVAYYPLDGDAADAGPAGLHGTIFGATPTEDRFGNPDGALFFDAPGDYVETPLGSNFKPLSFSVWFRPDLVTGERSIVDSDIGGRYGHSLIVGYGTMTNTPTCSAAPCRLGDATLDVQFHNGAHDTGVPVVAGEWYHVAVSYSATVDVWVNGDLVLSLPYPGTVFDGSPFRFGRHNPGDPQWFVGAMDDVRFWDRALTDAEVEAMVGAPPVADAGGPYSVQEGGTVTFDGTGSSDPDGDIVAYAWTLPHGGSATGAEVAWTADGREGTWPVTLTVTDARGASASATTTVRVVNRPPTVTVVSLGAAAHPGEPVELFVELGDPGDDPLKVIVEWGDGDTWTLTTPGPQIVKKSHAYAGPGSYPVRVRVLDDGGGSTGQVDAGTVEVTVDPQFLLQWTKGLPPATIGRGAQSSVLQRLVNIDRALRTGDTTAAANRIRALVNFVTAQRGHSIRADVADTLLAYLDWMLTDMGG